MPPIGVPVTTPKERLAELDVPPVRIFLAGEDAETLARCEAVGVIGRGKEVDVRMPAALWERISKQVKDRRRP